MVLFRWCLKSRAGGGEMVTENSTAQAINLGNINPSGNGMGGTVIHSGGVLQDYP